MNKVKIIVDSTSDLENDYIKAHDIEVIGLGVNFGEEKYTDRVDITNDMLYQKVNEKGMLPKTSAVPLMVLIDVFQKYIDLCYDIFYTGISVKMSSSNNNALLASKQFPEGRIIVFDSENLSTGIGLQVLKAVELRDQGKSIQEIKDALTIIRPKVRSQFMIETLDYLYKGGRCSSLSFFFGKKLGIKPIIRVKDGAMFVYKKAIGKSIKALNLLLDIFKKDLSNVDLGTVMITSTNASESEKYLYDELSKIIDPKHIMITHAGCVISSHCGPGTIGILYILKENQEN